MVISKDNISGQSTPYPLDVNSPQSGPKVDNCVTMNINNGEFHEDVCIRAENTPLPFVCKKTDDESCPTIDRGNIYSSTYIQFQFILPTPLELGTNGVQ